MMAQASRDWSVFKQIFADHWQGFKQFRPRYDTPYYDRLVEKMLDCGNPDHMGYMEYRCEQCGQGKHVVNRLCACDVPKSTSTTGSVRSARRFTRVWSIDISS